MKGIWTIGFVAMLGASWAEAHAADREFLTDGVIDQSYGRVVVRNDATVDKIAGEVVSLLTYDTSTLNHSGGRVQHGRVWGRTRWNVLGGVIETLSSFEYGAVNISGGQVDALHRMNGTAIITGGAIGDHLTAYNAGAVSICGYDFQYDPAGGDYDGGQITGYWANGASFSIDLSDDGGATDTYSRVVFCGVPGDANRDGLVNVFDLAIVGNNYGMRGLNPFGDARWVRGDFSDDGNVDVFDLAILANYYGWTMPGGGGAVPEPATLALLVVGGLAMIRRRR